MRRMNEVPKGVFAGVRTNILCISTPVAKSYPQSGVVLIEAQPPAFEKLRFKIGGNCVNNVRIIDVAVRETEDVVDFFYAGCYYESVTTAVTGCFKFTAIPVSC